jgi:hypothetical protein
MWRRYLKLAYGYTAAHKDGIVKYTAHELRHLFAQDRASILKAMNQAVSRLYLQEDTDEEAA